MTDRRARSWPPWLRWGLLVVGAQACAVGVYLWVEHGRRMDTPRALRAERLDAPAPPLTLRRPDGTVLTLAAQRGRLVLLHFWATWCAPCRVELPALLELGRELCGAERCAVVAAAVDDDWPAVRKFFAGAIPPEVVTVPADVAERLYGVSTLPDTYLVDAEGTLRRRFLGGRDWQDPAIREMVESMQVK